jgi:superfamily I DNA/RNA helicase
LPHARTVEGDGDVEEERRLAYVAVTRARAHLTVSWCRTRARYGKLVPRDRSRFLEGLPDDDVEWLDGEMRARTEDEKKAVVDAYRAQIRAKLGLG